MTAYLKRGDRIMLAVPDFAPGTSIDADYTMWRSIYEPLGVTVEHVAVHHALAHPVVVAVLRDDQTAEGDQA